MLEIKRELLKSSNECEKVETNEIKIAYIKNEKELFLIFIKPNESAVRFILKTQQVTSTDEMIFLLEKYRDFLTENITLDGKKVFGDIIISNKFAREINNETIKNVKKSLSYWNEIISLEEILKQKFKFNMPLSNIESEKIEILKNSFINNEKTVIGNLKNVCMTSPNLKQLENIKGKTENLVLIINNPKDSVCGVDLGTFYKRIEYGPVKIVGYKILDEIKKDDNTLLSRYLLDLEEQKDTKAEIRYFLDKESAMGNQK